MQSALASDGYAVIDRVVDAGLITELAATLDTDDPDAGGVRNLLETVPAVRALLTDPGLIELVCACFVRDPFVVKATLFDKRADRNWFVRWHQDHTIAVDQRHDVDGYGPWSVKAGVPHVDPPAEVLENMLAVRVHIDPCGDQAGPLKVIPGSHIHGRFSPEVVESLRHDAGPVTCSCSAGGVVLMRPLTLHASSKTEPGMRRRVIHFEVTDTPLPKPLAWALAEPFGGR